MFHPKERKENLSLKNQNPCSGLRSLQGDPRGEDLKYIPLIHGAKKIVNVFLEKLNQSGLDLPVNKYVVGRNKSLDMRASEGNALYEIALWQHDTYILPNEPEGGKTNPYPKKYSNILALSPMVLILLHPIRNHLNKESPICSQCIPYK